MGGRASKQKGPRVEREIVNYLKAKGFKARRVPMSGAASRYAGKLYVQDVHWWLVELLTDKYVKLAGESKARKNGAGFKTIVKWMAEADFLVLKQNHEDPLIVFRLPTLVRFLKTRRDNATRGTKIKRKQIN